MPLRTSPQSLRPEGFASVSRGCYVEESLSSRARLTLSD